jgi:hypothetical protein
MKNEGRGEVRVFAMDERAWRCVVCAMQQPIDREQALNLRGFSASAARLC